MSFEAASIKQLVARRNDLLVIHEHCPDRPYVELVIPEDFQTASYVEYTIDSDPTGLTVTWDGVARETPFTVQTVVGGKRDLTAAAVQTAQQTRYELVGWSDGGAAVH